MQVDGGDWRSEVGSNQGGGGCHGVGGEEGHVDGGEKAEELKAAKEEKQYSIFLDSAKGDGPVSTLLQINCPFFSSLELHRFEITRLSHSTEILCSAIYLEWSWDAATV